MSDSTSYELQRLITIGTFSTPWEAQLAQARLNAEGLHSLIANEHVIRMVALSNAVGGVQLKVREQDAEAATEVLRRLAPLPEIYLVATGPAAARGGGAPHGADPADPSDEPDEPDEAAESAGFPGSLGFPASLGSALGTSSNVAGSAPPAAPSAAMAAAARACPACGSPDLQPERSSRRLLGMLPVSRRGYRCGACGILWGAGEIGGQAAAGAAVADQGGAPHAGEDTALHTVARFHTTWEAHLARTFLESEGLRCCVLEERLPAVHLLSAEAVAYNRLEVRRADAGRAAEILARAWSGQLLAAVPDDDLPARREPEDDPEQGPPAEPPVEDPLDAPGTGEPAWRDPPPREPPRRDP
jgi:hypothetical protein